MTECQIIPFPRPSEPLVVQPDGRWTNGVDQFCAKPGPCPCSDPCRLAVSQGWVGPRLVPAPPPPARKRPLLFAVPNFDPPRKRARKPQPSGASRVLEPA
jgi:hypothetical protein